MAQLVRSLAAQALGHEFRFPETTFNAGIATYIPEPQGAEAKVEAQALLRLADHQLA